MPWSVAESLRQQSADCLRVAKSTSDNAVRQELLAAAAWLHDEAQRIEELLRGRGGSGTGSGPGIPPKNSPNPSSRGSEAGVAGPRLPSFGHIAAICAKPINSNHVIENHAAG